MQDRGEEYLLVWDLLDESRLSDISLVEHLDTDHCNTIKGMFFNYNIDGCCSVWRKATSCSSPGAGPIRFPTPSSI